MCKTKNAASHKCYPPLGILGDRVVEASEGRRKSATCLLPHKRMKSPAFQHVSVNWKSAHYSLSLEIRV